MISQRMHNRRGIASILAMMFLVLMSSLAVAFFTTTDLGLKQTENLRHVAAARLEAESGLAFLTYQLRRHAPTDPGKGQELLSSLAGALGESMDLSGTLQGGNIVSNGQTVAVPPIAVNGDGRNFDATISLVDDTTVLLRVVGYSGNVSRAVGVQFSLKAGGSKTSAFDFGIASRGPISMTGNAKVLGANNIEEADMLSGIYGVPEAFSITGNSKIEGDIHVSDPDTTVKLSGNIEVGGESMVGTKTLPDPEDTDPIVKHVQVGVGKVDFPEVDPTQFESFAVNIVDGSTNTSGNKTFNNIRIRANTNKTFAGNVTLNGVIFIEVPNRIHFSGNVKITGVIVTQDAGDNAYESNTIKFSGNLTANGVEDLPDTSEFHDLRQKPGSFILAPGFGTEFVGNFGTVNGCMAADKFKWTGNASGRIKGGIIAYSDAEFKMTGNSCITIDRHGTPDIPSGFGGPGTQLILVILPDTYIEY